MNNLATQMDINDPQLSVPPPIVKRTHTPSWLANAMETYRVKYPYDRFEVILRTIKRSSPPECRLRCSDCPGKLYKPGPGKTLSNFEVHLKNRVHRQSVDARVGHGTASTGTRPALTQTSIAHTMWIPSSDSESDSAPDTIQVQQDTIASSLNSTSEVSHTSESVPPPASAASISAPSHASASTSSSTPVGSPNRPLPWLSSAMTAMMAKYPDDKFEVILRRIQPISPPEWRLKCSDCPGKVYKPGPGETLSNFEVHLKNRSHRQCVDARVDDAAKPQAGLSPPYLQQSNEMALEA